jgi:uncharacterized protein (TIGR00369 family)
MKVAKGNRSQGTTPGDRKVATSHSKQGALTKAQVARLGKILKKVPFARLVGIELASAQPGSATLRLAMRQELEQIHGVMHGGAIAALIDTATAFAIVTLLLKEKRFVTVDLTVSYLRPLTKGFAIAEARVLRAGQRLITVSAEVMDDDGNLAATALSTYLKLS